MKKQYNKILSFIFLGMFLLSGCVTSYKPRGFSGGYYETQLDKNMFKVGFDGNSNTKIDRISDLLLLRNAEITLKNGYNYFVVSNNKDYKTSDANSFSVGDDIGFSAFRDKSKSSSSNIILCFKEKPTEAKGIVYDAKFIYDQMTVKYKVKK